MSREITSEKAWATVNPQGRIQLGTTSIGPAEAILALLKGDASSWTALKTQGWRVIPVTITPDEGGSEE